METRGPEKEGETPEKAAETPSGNEWGPFPTRPRRVPLDELRDVESRLVSRDEELDFGGPGGPPEGGIWPRVDPRLGPFLREGNARYRRGRFEAAAAKFATALQLCSRGFATEDPLGASPEDVSRLASLIEARLVGCYLSLGQPGIALGHSHRSVVLNPSYFRHHLRQAACLRSLRRFAEAARSAMVADCLYVLAGGTSPEISGLIQLYWQALLQESLHEESSFCVLYTPFEKEEEEAERIKEANQSFAEKHPQFSQHIFTDPHGIHLLPEGAEAVPDQQYLLTLGFRSKELGRAVEKALTRKLPLCPGQKSPLGPGPEEEPEAFWETTGQKVLKVLDFIGGTKIKDQRSPCARAMEQFQRAGGGPAEQRGPALAQVMAELATVPFLHRGSQEDHSMLRSLTADAADVLEGRAGDRVWTKIQKLALIEEDLREAEEDFLRAQNSGLEIPGQEFLRLENPPVLVPHPRGLASEPRRRDS